MVSDVLRESWDALQLPTRAFAAPVGAVIERRGGSQK